MERVFRISVLMLTILTASTGWASKKSTSCGRLFTFAPTQAERNLEASVLLKKFSEADESELFRNGQKIEERLTKVFGPEFQKIEAAYERTTQTRSYMGRLDSANGEAKWSEPNSQNGWQANFTALLRLYKILDIRPGTKVIDIGSGYGRPGLVLGMLHPEAHYLGYEIVPHRTVEAKRLAKVFGLSNVKFKNQDVSVPDFSIARADVYYMYDPVNDATHHSLARNIIEANEGRAFKVVVQHGGNGKYEEILQAYFGRPIYLGQFKIFESKRVSSQELNAIERPAEMYLGQNPTAETIASAFHTLVYGKEAVDYNLLSLEAYALKYGFKTQVVQSPWEKLTLAVERE